MKEKLVVKSKDMSGSELSEIVNKYKDDDCRYFVSMTVKMTKRN